MKMNYDYKHQEAENLRDLDRVLGYLGSTKNMDEAYRYAQNNRAPQRVQDALLKAAQSGATSDNIGVSITSGFGQFFSQMRNIGVADAMAPVLGGDAEILRALCPVVLDRSDNGCGGCG